MGNPSRPHTLTAGAKDRTSNLRAATKRKPAAVGERDEPVGEQGVRRGNTREAHHRTAPAGRSGGTEATRHRVSGFLLRMRFIDGGWAGSCQYILRRISRPAYRHLRKRVEKRSRRRSSTRMRTQTRTVQGGIMAPRRYHKPTYSIRQRTTIYPSPRILIHILVPIVGLVD